MSKTQNSKQPIWALVVSGFVVTLLWASSAALISFFWKEDRGIIGDQFGAINALFTGLAFAGLIYTILLQREELQSQREELALTREEIKGQKQELENQNKTLRLQRFDNTFFNLLSTFNEVVNKSIFEDAWIELKRSYDIRKKQGWGEEESINDSHERVYRLYEGELGHYYRILYRILVFVDDSPNIDADKLSYVKMLRSLLSNQELKMLFYNCVYTEKGENLLALVLKYGLLDNLPYKDILHISHLKKCDLKAFGNMINSEDFQTNYNA